MKGLRTCKVSLGLSALNLAMQSVTQHQREATPDDLQTKQHKVDISVAVDNTLQVSHIRSDDQHAMLIMYCIDVCNSYLTSQELLRSGHAKHTQRRTQNLTSSMQLKPDVREYTQTEQRVAVCLAGEVGMCAYLLQGLGHLLHGKGGHEAQGAHRKRHQRGH